MSLDGVLAATMANFEASTTESLQNVSASTAILQGPGPVLQPKVQLHSLPSEARGPTRPRSHTVPTAPKEIRNVLIDLDQDKVEWVKDDDRKSCILWYVRYCMFLR